MAEEPRALFSSTFNALNFALNFDDDRIPGPLMNRAMADTPLDRARAEAATRAYTGGGRRSSVAAAKAPTSVPLGGTADRAIMAGWILQRFQHLEVVQRLVLTITVQRPRVVCSCGSPCCRGWTLKLQWVEAVRILAEHLRVEAQLTKGDGRRGFSTDPRLRIALVEDFARPQDKRWSLAKLAEATDVGSTTTVATHRAKIHGYLQEVTDAAWAELAAIFDAHGITGEVGS